MSPMEAMNRSISSGPSATPFNMLTSSGCERWTSDESGTVGQDGCQ